jgi:extracellular factor (EF) 3-hydroxypalmitic acid methyl ester biosynthesis protein
MTTQARLALGIDALDDTYDALLSSDVHAAMGRLRLTLQGLRMHLPPDDWTAVGEQARQHPLHELLLESPFTRRAYTKPRGYAGDAGLMDLIYGFAPEVEGLSPLGAMLYAYEFDSPCFRSVRSRRAILAREIDEVARHRPGACVLSVASGHLRELEWSRAACSGTVSITAVDQDPESLDFVSRRYASYGIQSVSATIGDLLRRPLRFAGLDLVYAAGLYDYLPADVGRTLTFALFRMLRPGGRLLIANFTPSTHDAAFMEAIMDWHLIYRTAEAVRALTDSIPQHEISGVNQFRDENEHVTYLRLSKR